jgi:hypothetical protein
METEKQCKRCKAMQEVSVTITSKLKYEITQLLKDVEQRNSYITQLKDKMEKMKEAALEGTYSSPSDLIAQQKRSATQM